MKIELELPYSKDWKKAYLRVSPIDGRARLDLVNSETHRTTTAYARYLLAVKLGRYLSEDEEADHINNDCSNDDLDNLQVLSVEEHKAKTKAFVEGRNYTTCVCAYCQKEFQREVRNIKNNKNLCSRSCNAKYNREYGGWTGKGPSYSEQDIEAVRELRRQGFSDYKIGPILNMKRSRVQRIRSLNNID